MGRFKRLAVCSLWVSILAGCQTTPVAVCPSIVEYPPEVQQQAADELDSLPKPSALGRLMADYGQLRNKLRVCQ